jgi:hypothetical protein
MKFEESTMKSTDSPYWIFLLPSVAFSIYALWLNIGWLSETHGENPLVKEFLTLVFLPYIAIVVFPILVGLLAFRSTIQWYKLIAIICLVLSFSSAAVTAYLFLTGRAYIVSPRA